MLLLLVINTLIIAIMLMMVKLTILLMMIRAITRHMVLSHEHSRSDTDHAQDFANGISPNNTRNDNAAIIDTHQCS